MTRIVESYRKHYPMLQVYRDDLEHIVSIVKEHCQEVMIKADKYQLDDIEELGDLHQDTLPSFSIEGFMHTETQGAHGSELLHVELSRTLSNVYVSSVTCTPPARGCDQN